MISDGESPDLPPEFITNQPSYIGGSLTKIGRGTLTLTGTNSYTGGTIINGGTLQLGNGGTSGSVLGNIIDNGILAFNRSDSFAFPGVISGSGIVRQNGTGTLTLTGANTYGGGTTIAEGTMLTQNASALGTGPVTFGNGTTLAVENLLNVNGNWTVSPGTANVSGGTVQTFGDFNLGGGGTLIANANFNIPGTANINSSGFVVNSTFTVNDNVNLNGSSCGGCQRAAHLAKRQRQRCLLSGRQQCRHRRCQRERRAERSIGALWEDQRKRGQCGLLPGHRRGEWKRV